MLGAVFRLIRYAGTNAGMAGQGAGATAARLPSPWAAGTAMVTPSRARLGWGRRENSLAGVFGAGGGLAAPAENLHDEVVTAGLDFVGAFD